MSESAFSPFVRLTTPERVELQFRIAGPGSRLAAYGVDLTIRAVALYSVALALDGTAKPSSGWPMGVLLVAMFLLEWGYSAAFESGWRGQTPGKRAFGLRVVRTDGGVIGLREAWLRNLLRAADFAPLFYGAGLLTSIATRRMQRIGDLVANTMVVRDVSRTDAFDVPLLGPKASRGQSARTVELVDALRVRGGTLARARLDEIASSLAASVARRHPSPAAQTLAAEEPSAFLFRNFLNPGAASPVDVE